MSAADAAGLLGSPAKAAPDTGRGTKRPAAEDRREKLSRSDQVPYAFLEIGERSIMAELGDTALYKAISTGNAYAKYHSNLAASSEWRVGVGISQTAEALETALSHMVSSECHLKAILKESMWQKVSQELDNLLPHVRRLNMGKDVEATKDGTTSLERLKQDRKKAKGTNKEREKVTAEKMQESAEYVYSWLAKKQSPVRALLSIISGDGTFWAGHAMERAARATINAKPMSKDAWCAAARARCENGSTTLSKDKGAPVDDAKGLLED